MSVFQLPPDVLRVGEPTPFALRDKTGSLLIPRGMLVASDDQLQQLTARDLYVDEQDSEALKRAMAGKLDSMVRQGALIGVIAKAQASVADLKGASKSAATPLSDPLSAWSSLQMRASALLRDPSQPAFETGLMQVQARLLELLDADADAALMVLVHGATQEFHDYSVRHALLVAVVCELAARHVPTWSEEWRPSLRCAALTMNVAMTQLQNQLATQDSPPTGVQRQQIDTHASGGAEAMRAAGVTDELWLGAVARHHDSPPGPLANMPAALQLARLVQRADIFAARLSPRKRRPAMSATAAAKAAYLDENQKPDEAGSAIIKATGLYPPGCLVRLRSGEVAVVLRRGRLATEPVVASVVNAAGHAIAEPAVRNTRQPACAVAGGVAAHEIKVRLDLARLLKLS
jgi:HD-GYP domain-containing protein (c-di-GMP phosphodiesterase class II)